MKDFTFFILLFFYFTTIPLFAQNDADNMVELFHFDSGQTYNDCWGYVDNEGNEYAIVGTRTEIYFYDITDPVNTVLIESFYHNSVPGLSMGNSLWRDFKTYGEKAYACADVGSEGLLVFDLSDLPNSVTFEEQNTTVFSKSHNIFIDTLNGFLYTAGANVYSNGTRVLDLKTDPISIVGGANLAGGYIHDIHVRNGLAYCFSGHDGMYVYDFSEDLYNPTYLGVLDGYINEGYNHSGWLTDSGDHMVFCDETDGRKVKICDVSDHNNIEITDQFHSNSPVSTSLAHNPFIIGDLVYVSYYDDGVYVFDISDPYNVTTFAYYDTNPVDGGNGCWGVYPYYPSGSIIASDMGLGFYVLQLESLPLPVKLTRFVANPENEKVKMEWTTSSEKNSSYFEIQRSRDGNEFESINKVNARGQSTAIVNYESYDPTPFKGLNYYRLKQVDLDGKFEYSDVISVYFSTSAIEIYPSYISNSSSLKVLFSVSDDNLELNIYNVQCQLMKNIALSGVQGEEVQVPLDHLNNGTYIVHAFNDNQQLTKRIVVSR